MAHISSDTNSMPSKRVGSKGPVGHRPKGLGLRLGL